MTMGSNATGTLHPQRQNEHAHSDVHVHTYMYKLFSFVPFLAACLILPPDMPSHIARESCCGSCILQPTSEEEMGMAGGT